MKKKSYYIFGLQRSGTNYFQRLMDMNFRAHFGNRGGETWKHRITVPEMKHLEPDYAVFVLRKNPYKWIESLCLRNQVDWTKRQKKYPADDRNIDKKLLLGENQFNIINLAKTYRESVENWFIKLPEEHIERFYLLKYEDLLEHDSRIHTLRKIQERYGYVRKNNEQWLNPKHGSVSQSGDYNPNREKYYKDPNKLEALNRQQLDAVNEILTEDFMKKIGYQKL